MDREDRDALRRQKRYLEVLAEMAFPLIREVFSNLPSILEMLGRAAEVSRVYVFRNRVQGEEIYTSQIAEWCAEGVVPQIDNPELQDFPFIAGGFERWVKAMREGGAIYGSVREFPEPERSALEAQDIMSLLALPLFVEGEWWGFIGFDNCWEERQWDEAEVALLRAAAGFISLGIEWHRTEEALKEREQRFRAVFENAGEALYLIRVGPKGEFRYEMVNPAYVRMAGVDPTGKTPQEVFAEETSSRICEVLGEVVRTRSQYTSEETYTYPAGSREVVSIRAPILDARGRVVEIVGAVRDVTEERQAQRELEQQRHLAAIGQLAGGIAHDFNNVLTAILGYAELIMAKLPSESEVFPYIRTIVSQAERAARLVSQILAFARAVPSQRSPLELGSFLEEQAKLLRRIIPEHIYIQTDIPPGPCVICADVVQIQQVLMNLATNARDAMPEGGTLTLSLERTVLDEAASRRDPDLKPGPYALLRVRDTGIGMSPEVRRRALEPFFTTKDVGEGTGLGLSQAYGLIKANGGALFIESEEGKGTEVQIFLPLSEVESADEGRPSESLPLGTETVLLVEDDPAVRSALRDMLTALGYRTITAKDGEEALSMYRNHKNEIALVISDLVMPKMGGIELCRRICVEEPYPKFLFITGYTQEALLPEGNVKWAFLEKPIDYPTLAKAVRDILEGSDG